MAIALYWRNVARTVTDWTMPWRKGIQRHSGMKVPMRDGVRLNATVFLPKSVVSRIPTILVRTTYGRVNFEYARTFTANGYAVVYEDVRGRYGSEGVYLSPYYRTKEDGYDTIDWIVRQPWSNGKVGTFGCSYLGESQIMLASARHPAHLAAVVLGAGGAIGKAKENYGYFGVFENGVLNLASALGWFTSEGRSDQRIPTVPKDYEERVRRLTPTLPVARIANQVIGHPTGFDDFTRHALSDPWWEGQGYIGPQDRFTAATLHVNSWYDQTIQGTFDLAELMRENSDESAASNQPILIDAGLHCSMENASPGRIRVGEMEFDYSPLDFSSVYVNWFDHWLKQAPRQLPPRFQYFVIHANEWRTSETWPPARTQQRAFYLAKGSLSSKPEPAPFTQEYTYDPRDPVPTRGGAICCTYIEGDLAGAVDQSSLQQRRDVLHYVSDPLDADIDVVGDPSADLFVSTDSPDTDFTVKLLDVYPDGRAFNIQDGVTRLRYRGGLARPELASPNLTYKIRVRLRPVGYRIRAGHRLGLHVSSSNFPRLARNLNTGEDEYTGERVRVAHNRVFTGGDFPSVVWIPTADNPSGANPR